MEKESVGNKEVSADSSFTFWCTIGTKSGQISQPLVHLMDEMSNTAVKMNYHALLGNLIQEKIKNCEVSLDDAGKGGGFNHTSEIHVIKYNDEAWK